MKTIQELAQGAKTLMKGKGAVMALAAVGAAGALAFAEPLGGAAAAPAAPRPSFFRGFKGLARGQMITGAADSLSDAGAGGSFEAAPAARGAATMMLTAKRFAAPADPGGEAAPRKIVRAATMSVEVADEPKARALARAAALKAGAEITGDTTEAGEDSRCATLTFRVAPERFDALLSALEGVGRVTSRGVTTQNLSEEYVDLRSRLTNLRKVEKRLNDLLSFNTRKLADVLAVERELERVGREIETIEGRMKYIDHLAAASTVTVTLNEPVKEPAAQATGLLAEVRNALVGAFNTFLGTGLALVRLTCWLAAIAAWVAPLSLLGWKLKGWWSSAPRE